MGGNAVNSKKVSTSVTKEHQYDVGQEKKKGRSHANSNVVDEQNEEIQI